MKTKKFVYLVGVVALGMAFTSCEGPAGADGTNGTNGTNGDDGTPGVSGTAICMTCHSASHMDSISTEFAGTKHATGTAYKRGSSAECARCHSNEGFIASANLGGVTLATGISNPSPYTCKTCHGGHKTFNFEDADFDYALRVGTNDDVPLMIKDDSVKIDFAGPSNTCARCHQPRKMYTYYSVDENDSAAMANDSVKFSGGYAGPHYGMQSTIIFGIGGAPASGTISGTKHSSHANAGCVTCHMNKANHSFEPNPAACTKCHTTATGTDFDINDKQTEIQALLDAVKTKLLAAGILNADGSHSVGGTYHEDLFSAFWNYKMVLHDGSMGVHNYAFTKALLDNANAAL